MRILLITQSYLPVLGGLQQAVHDLARGLCAAGHTVQVVTHRHPRRLPAQDLINGVPVQRFYFFKPDLRDLRRGRLDLFAFSLFAAPTAEHNLRWLMRAFQPEVVHFHYPQHLIDFVLPAYQRQPSRLIVSFHGVEVEEAQNGTVSDRERLHALLRMADCITAVSSAALVPIQQMMPGDPAKYAVVSNGLEDTAFTLLEPYAHPRPYFLGAGRLVAPKGFDLLIEAFGQIAAKYPAFDLLLAGDGEARPVLEAQAQRLGLGDRVVFLGNQPRSIVARLMRGCHFLIVPSHAETFGLVALEAMALERRVIAARVGGLPELLDEAENQLVATTSEAISAALDRWLSDPAFTPRSAANRERAAQFSVRAMVQRYERLYHVR